MRTFLRKTGSAAGTLICICGAIVIIAAALCLLLHIRPAVVVSGSMEPAIHTGSVVFVDTEYDDEDIVERDIIAFEVNGNMVTHRVNKLVKDGFVTKGDANDTPDPAIVSRDRYLGRVIIWIPWIGYIIGFLIGTRSRVIILCAFASVMLISCLQGKEKTNGTEKNTGGADNSAA